MTEWFAAVARDGGRRFLQGEPVAVILAAAVRHVADGGEEAPVGRRFPHQSRTARGAEAVIARQFFAFGRFDFQPRIQRRAGARGLHGELVAGPFHGGEGEAVLVSRGLNRAGDGARNRDRLGLRGGVVWLALRLLRHVRGRKSGRRGLGGQVQAIDAVFVADETDAGARRVGETHELDDVGSVARRAPGEQGIERAAIVVERELRAGRVDEAQHAVEGRAEDVGLHERGERLALLERDRERIDVAGLLQTPADRHGQRVDFLRRFEVVVRLHFEDFVFGGHEEEARRRGALRIEHAHEMRPQCGVLRDLDGELSLLRCGMKREPRRIGPDLRRPGIERATWR